jgi:hypothetical protein
MRNRRVLYFFFFVNGCIKTLYLNNEGNIGSLKSKVSLKSLAKGVGEEVNDNMY